MSNLNEGWGWPLAAYKAHYFIMGKSLCGQWVWFGGKLLYPVMEPSNDDCAKCRRKLEIRQTGGSK